MKQTIRTAAIITCAAAFLLGNQATHADSNSVYSVNIVGFQQIELDGPSQRFLVAPPFLTGDQNLEDLFAEGALIESGQPATADKILYWDTEEQQYVSLGHFNSKFYRLTADGAYELPPVEVNPHIPLGSGFWVSTASDVAGARPVTLSGDVLMDDDASVSIIEGLQIVSFPFATDMPLGDFSVLSSGATAASVPAEADQVIVWNVEQQQYERFALFENDGNWYALDGAGSWILPPQESTHVFQPGEAFWYRARNSFTWQETRPFDLESE